MGAECLLNAEGLDVWYGSVQALSHVSVAGEAGQLVAILGTNGGGKSSLLNVISGFVRARRGSVSYMGRRIDGLPAHQRARAGIVQVSQFKDLFPGLSVRDNLRLGALFEKDPDRVRARLGDVCALFPRLAERMSQRVVTLSGGEQQMVAVGRALMQQPRILLLDEPTAGLAPVFVRELGEAIRTLKQQGICCLLVEHNTALALSLADRFYVLRNGELVHQGATDELRRQPEDFLSRLMLGLAPDGLSDGGGDRVASADVSGSTR